ncbi:GUN4 domain-containing protein [Capilliphycus salinus ALCB114379]|uniref:GUN4 domain-containing protein n=1 Tax=Capilliphycus salinus TaxID=2768948 RepID=UPI0039A56AAC
MFKCPVCQQEYLESVPEFCSVCHWNLQSGLSEEIEVDLESVRLQWAREKWQELNVLKQELERMRFPGQNSSLNSLNSFSDLSRRLETIEAQLQQATVERTNLNNQLEWVLHYLELLDPERVSNTISRLENWLEGGVEETPLMSEVGMDYQPLSELLAAGDWKTSDQYTWQILLYLAGREAEGWLRIEDIENFPGADLKTIDYLWNYYSNGLFGLGVQQQIFDGLAGDYPAFCDAVGWREGENWRYYDELIFNPKAPPGHLPVIVWRKRACYGMGSGTAAENISLFLNRFISCQNS